jgi:hypothetical protein
VIAIVFLSEGKLQLVRHPVDQRIVAFDDADAAFCFAVSLEIAGAQSAGTVEAPAGEPLYVLPPGTAASDITRPLEVAA